MSPHSKSYPIGIAHSPSIKNLEHLFLRLRLPFSDRRRNNTTISSFYDYFLPTDVSEWRTGGRGGKPHLRRMGGVRQYDRAHPPSRKVGKELLRSGTYGMVWYGLVWLLLHVAYEESIGQHTRR